MSALALKNWVGGNSGELKMPHLIYLSGYIKNYCPITYLMLVLVGDGLSEVSLTGNLGLEKLSEGNMGDPKKLCLFLHPFIFIRTINWTSLMPVLVGNDKSSMGPECQP